MIEVRIDDLAFVSGEAIARPVTATMGATTSLLRRLEQAAGPELAQQLRLQEPLEVGSAVVTGAGALGVELLIHAVVSSDTEPVTRSSVRRAMTSALQRAHAWQISHLAVPPFGLGAGNLDIEESADEMLHAIQQHCSRNHHPERITIVVESADEADTFERRLRGGGR